MRGKPARPVPRGRRRSDAPSLPEWRIWFYLLEAAGLDVQLVNARQVKAMPGRKTDVSDAVWLAQLAECGLLRASFVPPEPIRQLRDLTRYRSVLTATREAQRLEKELENAGYLAVDVRHRHPRGVRAGDARRAHRRPA